MPAPPWSWHENIVVVTALRTGGRRIRASSPTMAPPTGPFLQCSAVGRIVAPTLAGGRVVTGDNVRVLNNGADLVSGLQST